MNLHLYIFATEVAPYKSRTPRNLMPTLCTALTTVHINSKRYAALAALPLSSKEMLTSDTQSCVNTT